MTSATEPTPDRESIWSISPGWRTAYFALFVVQNVAGIVLVVWNQVFRLTEDDAIQTILNISQGAGQVTVGSAGTTLTITEGVRLIMVLGEQLQRWFRQREDRRVEERSAEALEALEEARRQVERAEQRAAEVRAEVRADARRQVAEWDRRRREAEARGEPFDEPIPNFDSNGEMDRENGQPPSATERVR